MSGDVASMTSGDRPRRAKPTILAIGTSFGNSPEFESMRNQLGLERWPMYFAGRGGMLGVVEPEVVAAAMGFFAPSLVASAWNDASRVAPPPRIAAIDAAALGAWGRRVLGGVPAIDRLASLAERVVAAADAFGLPLFAAWKAFSYPDDHPGARAALALNRLREHRGALHLVAIRAVGLTPLDAILAGAGAQKARDNGWSGVFPEVRDAERRRGAAEQRTDELAHTAYAILDAPEADELVACLDRVGEHLRVVSDR